MVSILKIYLCYSEKIIFTVMSQLNVFTDSSSILIFMIHFHHFVLSRPISFPENVRETNNKEKSHGLYSI